MALEKTPEREALETREGRRRLRLSLIRAVGCVVTVAAKILDNEFGGDGRGAEEEMEE